MREPAHGGGPRHQLGGHPAPRATHPSWRVAQRQRHACEVKMAPEAWLAAVVHLAHTAEAATTARDARCRLDVADQARLGELHRLDDSELDSEHGVEQGCSAHGRRGSEGWFGNPRGTPSAVRVPQPLLLAHLVPTDPRRIPPPCDEITPAKLPPNLSESLNETLEARMKLATEEQNIRYARFEQEPYPAIFLLGDLNDALFDFPDHLRWTVHFRDPIEKDRNPKILLDHILFTQAIVADHSPLPFRIHSGAGKVEHLIFDELMPCSP